MTIPSPSHGLPWERSFLLIVVLSIALLSGAGCKRGPLELAFSGITQGTTYSVKILADNSDRKATLAQLIQARLDNIDKTLSTYRPDSEISRFNQHNQTTPFPVSKDFLEVVQLATNVSKAASGAFDITAAPLIDAWGFGSGEKNEQPPTENEIQEIRKRIGYNKIEIDPAASTLRKTQSDVVCNINAIAQGYTVDKIAEDLDAEGIANYMVEVGGEVRAKGQNIRGVPWQIGIEKPIATGRALAQIVALTDTSLSTSGDYRNYYEKDGVRFSHTIDPQTGRPITHTLASISVIHPQCSLADAFATAIMVLGPEKGYDFAQKQKLPALFIIHTGDDKFTEKTTPEFAAFSS